MTNSQDRFEKPGMSFISRVGPIILIVVCVIGSTILFAVYTRLPFFICFFWSFLIGGFVATFIIFLIEKFQPNKKAPLPSIISQPQNSIQFDEDIKVIVSFGRSIENLPVDAFPKASDLEYSIARIEEAIGRLKLNKNVPTNMIQALYASENFLSLFKTRLETERQ